MAYFYWVHISLVLYAVSALFYLARLVFRQRILSGLGKRFLLLGFIVQSVALGLQFFQAGYPFLVNSGDAYFFSAWALAGLYLLISLRYPLEMAGSLFLTLILVLAVFAHFQARNYGEAMQSPWAAVHIVFAFLAFSTFCLCFIMGCLFLFQEHQLKRKKSWSEKLPPLEVLEKLHYKALSVGFALLTFGIVSGSAWAKTVKGVYFFDDPRQLWTLIAWLLYAFFFQARFSAGWRGRRSIFLSLMGFAVILFTFLEVQHL